MYTIIMTENGKCALNEIRLEPNVSVKWPSRECYWLNKLISLQIYQFITKKSKYFTQKECEFTWMMMMRQIPAPISEGSPYMPVITYTIAWPMVMIIPKTGGKISQLDILKQM